LDLQQAAMPCPAWTAMKATSRNNEGASDLVSAKRVK
jgi:hypothetical protein